MAARLAIRKSDNGGTIEFRKLRSVLLCPQYQKNDKMYCQESSVIFLIVA